MHHLQQPLLVRLSLTRGLDRREPSWLSQLRKLGQLENRKKEVMEYDEKDECPGEEEDDYEYEDAYDYSDGDYSPATRMESASTPADGKAEDKGNYLFIH